MITARDEHDQILEMRTRPIREWLDQLAAILDPKPEHDGETVRALGAHGLDDEART